MLHGIRGGMAIAFNCNYLNHSISSLQIIGLSGKRFHYYSSVSGLAEESELRQVKSLLYCLGEEADYALASTNISEDDRKKYQPVLNKFDDFFQVRRNIIFEDPASTEGKQLNRDSAEQYIT